MMLDEKTLPLFFEKRGFTLIAIEISKADYQDRLFYYLDCQRRLGDARSFPEVMREAQECLSRLYTIEKEN